jgi:hypothetical protein
MLEKIEEISNSLRETDRLCEYDFLIQLYKILSLYNFPILLPELNVMSGFSLRFLYSLDFQNAYNEDLDYLKGNLLQNINLNLSLYEEVDLKDLTIDKLKKGFPLILHPENLLAYKVDNNNLFFFRALFMESLPLEEVISKNKRAIVVETIPNFKREEIYDINKFSNIANKLFDNFFKKELTINGSQTFIGESAYLNFINDLRDEGKQFDGMRRDWFFIPSYAQWTSLYGLLSYFLGIYHFLDIKTQKEGMKIIKSLEDAILYWKDWGRLLGRDAHLPPARPIPINFRRIGANMLEKALKYLKFAINNMKYII